MIQDVERIPNAGLASMAYFYFDYKDIGKQDARALLTSLVIQLCDQSDFFYDILLGLYSAHRYGSHQPTNGALAQSLKKMITTARQIPIYLIIDALDECPDTSRFQSSREKVLELVKDLLESRHPNLGLCITSRPEIDIRTSLEHRTPKSCRISLHDQSGQEEDIIDYIHSVVYSDKKMKRWLPKTRNWLLRHSQSQLGLTGCNCIVIFSCTPISCVSFRFRWVSCQLDALRRCLAPSVRRVLGEQPETLDETYERILQKIPKSNRAHTHRLSQCLTIYPLFVEELAEVLAVDFSMAGKILKLNEDSRWEDQEQVVLSACSSLVAVVAVQGSRVVQFLHFSVKEFLTSGCLASKNDASLYHILPEPVHTIMAQACLDVLNRLD